MPSLLCNTQRRLPAGNGKEALVRPGAKKRQQAHYSQPCNFVGHRGIAGTWRPPSGCSREAGCAPCCA